jgi:hypothetical protein
MQEKVAAFKESLAQNQAALKAYTWTEGTEISLKGEVKKQEQKKCSYGPDGKVQKTPVGGQSEQKQQQESKGGGRRGGGAVKKAVVKNKVEDLKDYMEKAAALIQEYVPPDPQKIQAAAAAGRVSAQPGQGVTALTIKDYLKAGDSVIVGLDPSAKQIRSFKVQSYLDDPKDDAVNLAVTFANLPDGTNYPQQTVLDVVKKQVKVKVTNSGYAKAGE